MRMIQGTVEVKPQDLPTVTAAILAAGGSILHSTVQLTVRMPRHMKGRAIVLKKPLKQNR